MEEIRLKHMHIFLIITGAIISVFSFIIERTNRSLPQQSFENLLKFMTAEYGVLIITGSIFIFLYGFFLSMFLANQKRGYEHYRIVNSQIRKWFIEKYNDGNKFSFEKELSSTRTTRDIIKSTFFYWYLLIVLINVLAFMVCFVTFLSRVASSWPLTRLFILSALLSLCILTYECYKFIKINKEIKLGAG